MNDDTTTAAFTPIYGPTTGPNAPHLGTWAQLTGVYDASTQRMYLYVNGTQVSSDQYTGTTWNLQIGRRLYHGAYGENASANLSQVRVELRLRPRPGKRPVPARSLIPNEPALRGPKRHWRTDPASRTSRMRW
ncbi:LamG-like jellyroll fold domain-containing protein [Streptacidiphilus sp. PAMC 29251]